MLRAFFLSLFPYGGNTFRVFNIKQCMICELCMVVYAMAFSRILIDRCTTYFHCGLYLTELIHQTFVPFFFLLLYFFYSVRFSNTNRYTQSYNVCFMWIWSPVFRFSSLLFGSHTKTKGEKEEEEVAEGTKKKQTHSFHSSYFSFVRSLSTLWSWLVCVLFLLFS